MEIRFTRFGKTPDPASNVQVGPPPPDTVLVHFVPQTNEDRELVECLKHLEEGSFTVSGGGYHEILSEAMMTITLKKGAD